MLKRTYIIVLVLFLGVISCKKEETTKVNTEQKIRTSVSNLEVDHLNIWVKNPEITKEKLTTIGFTAVPDSLSLIHKGQGTTGRYFYFLNGYLELIFINDNDTFAKNNAINTALDFNERANFNANNASPFSIALKMKDYNADSIPFKTVKYHQDWMEDSANIFAAKNSKTHLKEPSIFVVYPEIESDRFETLADLKNIPEEYAIWREFFKHPNGAKKITKIKITSPNIDLNTETITAINGIENTTVKNGATHVMELFFDNNTQGKSFDLRPQLPLIIHL